MRNIHLAFTAIVFLAGITGCHLRNGEQSLQETPDTSLQQGFFTEPVFELDWVSETPVIKKGDKGTEQNKYGFG